MAITNHKSGSFTHLSFSLTRAGGLVVALDSLHQLDQGWSNAQEDYLHRLGSSIHLAREQQFHARLTPTSFC